MSEARAVLAGGCFWGMQDLLRKLPGVTATRVGYAGGQVKNPAYREVSTGGTGHAEAVEVTFDPDRISYRTLLEAFFQIHDPTTPNRQGNDRGTQYRSLILHTDDTQKREAEALIRDIEASGKWPGKVTTHVAPLDSFYEAEEAHQDYLEKNPGGYTCHWLRPDWRIDQG